MIRFQTGQEVIIKENTHVPFASVYTPMVAFRVAKVIFHDVEAKMVAVQTGWIFKRIRFYPESVVELHETTVYAS